MSSKVIRSFAKLLRYCNLNNFVDQVFSNEMYGLFQKTDRIIRKLMVAIVRNDQNKLLHLPTLILRLTFI